MGGEVGFRGFPASQRRGLVQGAAWRGVLDSFVGGSICVARDLREKTSPGCLVREYTAFVEDNDYCRGYQYPTVFGEFNRRETAATSKQALRTATDEISRAQIFEKFWRGMKFCCQARSGVSAGCRSRNLDRIVTLCDQGSERFAASRIRSRAGQLRKTRFPKWYATGNEG